MKDPVFKASGTLLGGALDALVSHVAVLDAGGTILAVNEAWRSFGSACGADDSSIGPGVNYLGICDRAVGSDSEEAEAAAAGIRAVLSGGREVFYLEYPCHSPRQQRWFSMRITRFQSGGKTFLVTSHDDITERYLAERSVRAKQRELDGLNRDLERVNRELLELAASDPLTGLANRREFHAVLSREWPRCRREELPLSLAVIDLNRFKLINDNGGHAAGDECLKQVARVIEDGLQRPADVAARLGGDEFALLLPATDEAGASQVCEGIRQSIESLRFSGSESGEEFSISASIGSATTVPHADLGPGRLLSRADKALYEAKRRGRNRVVSRNLSREQK